MANIKCIGLEDINHNLGCDGGNVSGIVPELIYGYYDDVEVWPAEPAPTKVGEVTTPLTLAAAGALVGDVVMKPGTRAYKMKFTEDSGSFKMGMVGEIDGEHFEYDLSIIKAKITATVLGFQNASITRKMFFIPIDENGNAYLMGNKRRGVSPVTGGDGSVTGTTASDRNQTSMNYKFRTGKALVYTGDVKTVLIQGAIV